MRAMATRSACERGVLPARALRAAFTWSLLLSAAAGNAPRGVPPSLAALYEASPEGRWKCFDSSAVLLASQVNDDFCDCADGSDEPGTPACGNAKFYCLNKGSKGKYLPSLAVNDGICDCCDGSDEYASKVTCPNVCDVEGSSMRAEQAERVRRVEEGVRARAAYAREARVAAEERERVRAATQQAITAAEGVKTKVQALLEPVEREEHLMTETLRNEQRSVFNNPTAKALRIDGYTADDLLQLLLDHVEATKTQDALVERVKGMVPASMRDEVKWEGYTAAPKYESERGTQLREQLASAEAELTKLRAEMPPEVSASKDYGPDSVFYRLDGQCFDLRLQQYVYQMCPYGAAKQDHTSLGHFKGWAPNAAGVVDYKAMEFTNGQTCWNGPARSLKVLLECDVTDALKSIEEPSKCTYEARFGTPAACDPTELEALKLMMEEEHAPAVKEDL